MATPARRLLGISLVITSTLGLLLSLIGLVLIARIGGRIAADVQDTLDLALSALNTTGRSLSLAEEALGEAAAALDSAQATTLDVRQTIQDTDTLLVSLQGVFGDELPQIVLSTRQSLDTAQQSARVVEVVLYGLNAISPLTGVTYNPEVPLSRSIANIDASLADLPQSLDGIAGDLKTAQDNFQSIESNLAALAQSLAAIKSTLTETRSAIAEYRTLVDDLSTRLSELRDKAPGRVRLAMLAVLLALLWLALSQIGLLFQGWEMMTYNPRTLMDKVAALEVELEKLRSARSS